ncbi:hypothetical protein LJC24_02185 [Desulfococcaceae bacterium OttesenSCG-928-F15]|nr:hypothetical protein [Desulfococcaceae bacterium OttesenSCG-928-F15]
MANQSNSVVEELDKRLDDLFDDAFSEDEPEKVSSNPPPILEAQEEQMIVPEEEHKPVPQKEKELPPIKEKESSAKKNAVKEDQVEILNALLLSIDWEVEDKTLGRYLEKIHQIRSAHLEDKVIVHFFQMLDSLGRYLRSRKVRAHPETIRIMQEIQAGLGQILDTKRELSEDEKRALLKIAYKRFQTFKDLISAAPQGKAGKAQNGAEKAMSPSSSNEMILQDMIRNIVREELEKFRKQLVKELHGAEETRT